MKTITTKMLLGAALLGALTIGTAVLPASARPLLRDQQPTGRPGHGRPGRFQEFTGRVTRVHSRDSFDLQVRGTTYNVYLRNRAPRGLNVGDFVRVSGVREDHNDIRNASVSILRNR